MESSCYLSKTSNVSVDPLKSDSNQAALKTLEGIAGTSIGPHGKLKIVQNTAGGHVTVTSSSQRLLHITSIKNTFLKLIVSSVKLHLNRFNDGGFCCLLLTLKLINISLSSSCPLPIVGKLFEIFGKIFIDFLKADNNASVFEIDLSSLSNFNSIVQSILRSKPGCVLREEDVQHLCILLMKAYLKSIPSTPITLFHKNIHFVTLEGASCDKSCLYDGLLIKLSELAIENASNLFVKSNIKIVLYTTSLSGDADFPTDAIEVANNVDVWDTVLTSMKNVFEKLINSEIDVLACQKVVHPSLRKQLEDANILVLDRLGHETAKHLEYLSGTSVRFPLHLMLQKISSVINETFGSSNSSLFTEPTFGCLTEVSKVEIGKQKFLLLTNRPQPFWTILICNFNEQAVDETKVVCQQVIDTLIRLLKKPAVCFGAGCMEIHTSKLVEQKVIETLDAIQQEVRCTTFQVLEALHIFLQSIADLAISFHQGSYLNCTTEAVHGHLWRLSDGGSFPLQSDKCLCGQFSAASVEVSSWEIFTKSVNRGMGKSKFCPLKVKEKIDRSVILDELSLKINAYSVAFETAALLLRVAVCVSS